MPQNTWSRAETLMALGLYLMPPDGRLNWDDHDPEVKLLATAIGRTANAVILKLMNLVAADPNRAARGFANGSKLDREIMNEYLAEPDTTLTSALELLEQVGICVYEKGTPKAKQEQPPVTSTNEGSVNSIIGSAAGAERIRLVKSRINQGYFRRILLFNYGGTCCLTGIDTPSLLIASHIKPWADSTPSEKTASSNGLLLNAFHDRAFDQGIITIDSDYCVRVSSRIRRSPINEQWLFAYEGKRIALPDDKSHSTWPSIDFLRYHNDCIFERSAV